jgi:predicted DNA binding CopG/RHH family protein
MRKSYDFSGARRNPYAKRLKKQVTIRLDVPTLDYFKELSEELGIPYQTLINHYLQECAAAGKRPSMTWRSAGRNRASQAASPR